MKKPSKRLQLVLKYGQQIQSFLADKTLADWQSDIQLCYAVSHALANIAENIKEYMQSVDSQKLTAAYPDVRWSQIARFRDKIIHHYEGVDQDTLYEFAMADLGLLLKAVMDIIESDSGSSFSEHTTIS